MEPSKNSIIVSDDCSESKIVLMEVNEEILESLVNEKRYNFKLKKSIINS